MKGLIVIGYQGIGKSTWSGSNSFIDLESGNFWIGDKRYDDWYIPYCQIAMSLADQGYIVFVSSHKVVVDFLKSVPLPKNVGKVIIFCPRRTMKDEWIERLKNRYERTNLEKDRKALLNAQDRFEENIVELVSSGLPVYQPEAMDYDLPSYINKAWKDWCLPND